MRQGSSESGRGPVGDRRAGSWSGSRDVTGRVFEHGLDCLFGDDDSVAKADGRQPVSASHSISQGTADAQKSSSFFNSKGQSV